MVTFRRGSNALRSVTDRLPSWVRQTAVLVVIYIAVLWALAHWLSAWHDWDWRFYDWLKPAPSALSSQIALVDMQYSDPTEIPKHRKMLAAFINRAAQQQPLAIVLDIPFGQCVPSPCDAPMASSRRAFILAITNAAHAKVPVYANVGDIKIADDGRPDGPLPQLDLQIYDELADAGGYGHTALVVLHKSESARAGDLFYYPCYPVGQGRPYDVWALDDVVLHRGAIFGSPDTRTICDANQEVAVPVRYGPSIPDKPPAEYQITESRTFPQGVNFNGKYVIVGVPARDMHPMESDRPGSELFAWVFSDELTYRQFDNRTIQAQNGALRALVPAFSAVTVLAYAACFLLLGRLRLGGARRLLPWISAALAFCVGAAVFVGFEVLMARGAAHQIQPQVGLISLGMALAGILSGVRGNQIEFERSNRIDDTASPETYDYDVFVSYAHEELPWVLEHVYDLLRNARLPGDKKLSIFFDTSSIKVGTAWQDKIAMAIDGSRFIVPVYSDAYFRSNYCRYEIKRAQRKWINAGEGSRCVLPVMRGHPNILQTVDDFQAKSIDDQPDIVEQIIAEIVERLSASPPQAAAEEPT